MAQKLTIPSTILVVEDEILIRMDAADYFADEGFDVLEAGSADEALRLLESRTDIDFVFSDINMPGSLDGLALSRQVAERWPTIGVIITSGMMRPAKTSLPGRTLFVEKPYEYKRLLDSLSRLGVSGTR
ncbi:response regulator receiver domain-containing protein [Rhizobium sp. PP-F2F-G48]|uniref:response regulator n=1 Tax=Rhizobium sp. PP-F2F-G48 TaxID=2135651 RepID=UPI00105227F6|nr:response regulator [Rhizobium sp. PP-F2F-G48]TCM45529.1 response regulator receiver domain-containing protein [Rhizobium sp. PP-F2F-G48]